MTVEVWFNPRCGTARNVRDWLDEHDVDFELREYLKDPPTKAEIESVLQKADIKASELLRSKEALAEELRLRGSDDEDAILAAMAEHPILINRPVVIDGDRAKLCRPADEVAEMFA